MKFKFKTEIELSEVAIVGLTADNNPSADRILTFMLNEVADEIRAVAHYEIQQEMFKIKSVLYKKFHGPENKKTAKEVAEDLTKHFIKTGQMK